MFARATGMVSSTMTDELVPKDTPEEVVERVAAGPRMPVFDPTLGHDAPKGGRGTPRHRLVTIGDSLSHGFQSGAIYNTHLSYPAIIARELGWFDSYRYPRYGGAGGLPLNLEYILRDLEHRYGADISPWELPLALFRARQVMDEIEDHWERGPGATAPVIAGYNHCLAVYGWDLRDALSRTAKSCETSIATPNDSLLDQIVENNGARAALRVYPRWNERTRTMTLLQAARRSARTAAKTTTTGSRRSWCSSARTTRCAPSPTCRSSGVATTTRTCARRTSTRCGGRRTSSPSWPSSSRRSSGSRRGTSSGARCRT